MNVSEKDAAEALDLVTNADQSVRRHRNYREAAPFFILWGMIWFFANAVTGVWPERGGQAWMAGIAVGFVVTIVLTVLQARRYRRLRFYTPSESRLIGRRAGMTGATIMAFFAATLFVMWPYTGMQQNAYISLCWAFAYMAAGAWLGWRLFITGLVTVVAILTGFTLLREHYFVWMAFAGGGSLILGGLWLRKL